MARTASTPHQLRYRSLLLVVIFGAMVFQQTIVSGNDIALHWSDDGKAFWFKNEDSDVETRFMIVDVEAKTRVEAFDHNRLATALSDRLSVPVNPLQIPITRMCFADREDRLVLSVRGQDFSWQRQEHVLTEASTQDVQRLEKLVQSRLFLPPRASRNGAQTTIRLTNASDRSLEIFWVNRGGRPTSYGQLEPGKEWKQNTYVGHIWLLRSDSKNLGCFRSRAGDTLTITNQMLANVAQPGSTGNQKPQFTGTWFNRAGLRSPDQQSMIVVQDHGLWVRSTPRGTDQHDDTCLRAGMATQTFANRQSGSADVRWSPDSKHLVASQNRPAEQRKVHFIEASPPDQLQPRLREYSYAKPGDALTIRTPRLFNLATKQEIPISTKLFDNPYDLRFLGWSANGDRFWMHYNQRGHQVVRLLEVMAASGNVRTIAEKTSETFVHYSNPAKSVLEELPENELLWASERSGWNHLYRYDLDSGQMINAVTRGPWNVKRIEKIDYDRQAIWFYAVGIYPDQDPYHEHFCRVNFDGSAMTILTAGDGTHDIQFVRNRRFFIDTYSRVDMAPVIEIRFADTGQRIAELSRSNTDRIFRKQAGRRTTERFVAPGRDGKTKIWGIIHWPKNFDPDRKYPVVENIYAGPHDHHVPKSFSTHFGHQYQISDAGMIVVQIDGMGTAWRSKMFHDHCYKNLRDAGFPDRIAWMRAAAKEYPQLDLSRVGIYGGSAGGQNAMAALLWHNDFYQVAVADCGCHDNRMDKIWWNEQWMGWPVDESYRNNSNTENAHRLKGHLMLSVGELDRNVDPATTTQVIRQLIRHDKDFEFVLVAGAGHGAGETPWAQRKRLAFLRQHLIPVEPRNKW